MADVEDIVVAVEKTLAKIGAEGISIKKKPNGEYMVDPDEHLVYMVTISREDREEKIRITRSLADDYLDSGERSLEWKRLIKDAVRKLQDF